jgi:hypothetical protein
MTHRCSHNTTSKLLACKPIDRYIESRLLLLEILEVDVLEILWQLVPYAMIGRPETSKRTK